MYLSRIAENSSSRESFLEAKLTLIQRYKDNNMHPLMVSALEASDPWLERRCGSAFAKTFCTRNRASVGRCVNLIIRYHTLWESACLGRLLAGVFNEYAFSLQRLCGSSFAPRISWKRGASLFLRGFGIAIFKGMAIIAVA